MIRYYESLKALVPEANPNQLEESINVIKKMDILVGSFDVRFVLQLDIKSKLWFFQSPILNCFFGLKKRYGYLNRYRANPIDAINSIFTLFRESSLENYIWYCLDCKSLNTDKRVIFESRITGFDYRIECKNCRTYHFNRIKNNKLITTNDRPFKNRWK